MVHKITVSDTFLLCQFFAAFAGPKIIILQFGKVYTHETLLFPGAVTEMSNCDNGFLRNSFLRSAIALLRKSAHLNTIDATLNDGSN